MGDNFDGMTRNERLSLAAALLESVQDTFNKTEVTCSHCGIKAKENWEEFFAGETVAAAATRIHKAQGILAKKEVKNVGQNAGV